MAGGVEEILAKLLVPDNAVIQQVREERERCFGHRDRDSLYLPAPCLAALVKFNVCNLHRVYFMIGRLDLKLLQRCSYRRLDSR